MPAFDASLIAALKTGRPTLFRRLLAVYLSYSPKAVVALLDAANDGNVSALKIASHSLKSSSANVGAVRLADLCRRVEARAMVGDVAGCAAIVKDLEAEYSEVARLLDAELAQVA